MYGRVGSFVGDGCVGWYWPIFVFQALPLSNSLLCPFFFYCSGWGNYVPGIHIFADITMSIGHGT